MILLGKIALGLGGTLVLAGAYTFREGVIRVDVDESRYKGSHVHFWVPAAAVPMTLHFVPRKYFRDAAEQISPWMPTIHAATKELNKFPNVDLVEVQDTSTHVQIRTHNGKLLIDVDDPDQKVHLVCPVETMEEFTSELVSYAPHP
jgi:hypothetical protein